MNREIILGLVALLLAVQTVHGEINYDVESFGSTATGELTPFWMVSNNYGIVPLKPNNAYLKGTVKYQNDLGALKLQAGVDAVTAEQHTSNLRLHQLYMDVSYRKLQLTVGSKEYYNSFLDRKLSQGDMCFSGNSRPNPEALLGFPEYADVPLTKGILKVKADFAVGKSLEDDYILRAKNQGATYTTGVLYHHKSLFLKIDIPEGKIPLTLTAGLVHAAQWGGWVSSGDVHKQPASFQDFIRIVMCSSGGESASEGDRINVLGNHLGTMNARLDYKKNGFGIAVYKQHFFDDKSGLEYANWRDGIWGGEICFPNRLIEKVVIEYLHTKNQSGPFHFIVYDNRYHYRGGGQDEYYNNGAYAQGWSYFGRTIGNPLLTSPEYNKDGDLYFKNNRVESTHAGISGKLLPDLSYRILLTHMSGYGSMGNPFLTKKNSFSFLTECSYVPAAWHGWMLGLQLASDYGSLYGNSFGGSLKIAKRGIICGRR
ncbi:MAG: capsule assembly Wzi family protein [Dysgonamonadaceae bacterium]|jgi:hypothetical protein|nr:capsule assembly Wzi family protein [Dysgonamonadaceae bacterium]